MAEDLKDLEGQLVNYGRLEEEKAEKARAAAAEVEKIKAERAALEEKVKAAGGSVPRVSAGSGNGNGDDVEKRLSRQEADSVIFDKLHASPGELTRLYLEDPKRFTELCKAKEAQTEKKDLRQQLFGGK